MKKALRKRLMSLVLTTSMLCSMLTGIMPAAAAEPADAAEPASGQVLMEVNFDDKTADDKAHNIKGTVVGEPEFVEGKFGSCIHIRNPKSIAGEVKAGEQYVKYGDQLKLEKNDFTVMFWYKSEVQFVKEGAIFGNKEYASGGNPGLIFADMKQGFVMNTHAAQKGGRHEIRLWDPAGVTDGQWHHIAGTFDRDGDGVLYIDGVEKGRVDISDIKDQSMDIADRSYNLGADGVGQCALEDGFIDEFSVRTGLATKQDLEDLFIMDRLDEQIAACRKLVQNSQGSEEAKQAFTAKIDDIEARAQKSGKPEEIRALMEELRAAKAEFLQPGEALACFDVMSDTHITNPNNKSGNYQGLHRAIQNILKHYPDTMGIFNSGDYTDSGLEDEHKHFFEIIGQYADQVEFTTTLGNHDVRWKPWTEIHERYMRYNAPYMPKEAVDAGKVYYDKWLGPDNDNDGKGDYHFIVLNSEYRTKDKSYFSDEQLNWFRETLAEDNEDGSKPVFMFTHEPLKDTIHWSNYWSLGEQDAELKEIMRDYPNTIVFTGHVHNGMNLVRAEQRDWGYAVDIPGFVSCDQGNPRGQYGWHVTVYEDRIVLDLYDYINDVFVDNRQETLWIPNPMAETNGQVLDVNFNDGTAKDNSGHGNDGTIHGDVQFVDGPFGDKAVHIVNATDADAQQYIDFGKLGLDKSNFTVMFWYKSDMAFEREGTMFSNKDWASGNNNGLVFGDMKQGILFNVACEGSGRIETQRTPSATDGKWHLVTAVVDRDGFDLSVNSNSSNYDENAYLKFYVDGQLVDEKDINSVKDKSIESGMPYVLGADGLHKLGIEDGYFDSLKVYKTALGHAEIRTLVSPFEIIPGGNAAILTMNPAFMDNTWKPNNLTIAYVYLDDLSAPDAETRKIPGYPEDNSMLIDGLKPNTDYKMRVVTVEKAHKGNITDVYEMYFTTKDDNGEVKFDLTALNAALEKSLTISPANKTTQAIADYLKVVNEAKEIKHEAEMSAIKPTELTQKDVDAAAEKLNKAMAVFESAKAPVASVDIGHVGMTATASSDCGTNGAEGAGNGAPQNAIDDNESTYWHNDWTSGSTNNVPHWIKVQFAGPINLSRVDVLPRLNHTNGHWSEYTMYIIDKDGKEIPVIEHGTFSNPESKDKRTITIEPTEAYGVKFIIHKSTDGSGAATEIDFYSPEVETESVSDVTVNFYALINNKLEKIDTQTGLTTLWKDGRQYLAADDLGRAYASLGFKSSDLKMGSALFLHRDVDSQNFWFAPTTVSNGKVYMGAINHKGAENEFDVFYQPNQSYKSADAGKNVTELADENFYTVTLNGETSLNLAGTDVTVKLPRNVGNGYWVCVGADGKETKIEKRFYTINDIRQSYTFKRVTFVETYNVIFKDMDGTQLGEAQTIVEGGSAVAPAAPVHEGYTFIGWDKAFMHVDSDLVITAKYEPKFPTFTDVNKGDWFYNGVCYVTGNGLFSGVSATEFGPYIQMNRAMVVQVLYSMAGKPAVETTTEFVDVPADSWYAKAVAWAVEEGIASGYGDGRFGAEDRITREQLAVMLYSCAGKPATEGEVNFADAEDISSWAKTAVQWAVENGIMSGVGGGNVSPKSNANRAEAAVMMMQFDKLMEK